MSMYGAVCAEAHIKIVRQAVKDALVKAKTKEARKLLKEVLHKCEMEIDE